MTRGKLSYTLTSLPRQRNTVTVNCQQRSFEYGGITVAAPEEHTNSARLSEELQQVTTAHFLLAEETTSTEKTARRHIYVIELLLEGRILVGRGLANYVAIQRVKVEHSLLSSKEGKGAMAGRGGGNFIARVMQYVVNELLVDRLANNQSFQRFAVRSSKTLEDLAQKGAEKKAELAEQLQEFTEVFKTEISKGLKDGPQRKR